MSREMIILWLAEEQKTVPGTLVRAWNLLFTVDCPNDTADAAQDRICSAHR